ncbi:hypothetical protein Tco_0058272 [Tanacetum coccineum]
MLERYFGVAGRSKDGSGLKSVAPVQVRLYNDREYDTRITTVTWCQEDQTRTTAITWCQEDQTSTTTVTWLKEDQTSLRDEGPTTGAEGVEAKPHSYF